MKAPTDTSIRVEKKIDQANISNAQGMTLLPLLPSDWLCNIEKWKRQRDVVCQRTETTEIALRTLIFLLLVGTDLDPKKTLLANSLGCLVQPFKSGNAGRSERVAVEPGDDADEIDRGRNAQMLQMRFWQSQIPRATQIKGTHSLRNSRFNPGP